MGAMTPRAKPTLSSVVLVAAISLLVLVGAMVAIIVTRSPNTSAPSGLRPPSGPVETAFAKRMSEEGHEAAFFDRGRVAVLIREAEWASLGRAGRFERQRFLAERKAELLALQQERGDKTAYVLTIQSEESQRLLAEETDFNPKFYD
jgi:hypothetical protein